MKRTNGGRKKRNTGNSRRSKKTFFKEQSYPNFVEGEENYFFAKKISKLLHGKIFRAYLCIAFEGKHSWIGSSVG
jgi:hypothetical protein